MAKLSEGKLAPNFSLPSTEGEEISLADYRKKKNVVLYFYPKDNTPGCTQESCDFRDGIRKFKSKDTQILGISADSLASHYKFKTKYKLPFPLLSDEGKTMLKKWGVWKKKSFMGREFMGIVRTTVVVDKSGKIRKIFSPVKVKEHTQEVLDVIKGIVK